MQVNFKTCALEQAPRTATISLTERLPYFIEGPCTINCEYSVRAEGSYYLLHLKTKASIKIECQRCLESFPFDYESSFSLALCDSEEQADKLMSTYESIVVESDTIDLVDILTDELHLSCGDRHKDAADCQKVIES